MRRERKPLPSACLESFLRFAETCQETYRLAYSSVGDEDKRLQDLLHALEFSDDKYNLHKEALKLWESRKNRREQKDIALLNRVAAEYFQGESGKKFLNELRQVLGRQRKEEQYLAGHREYRKRAQGKDNESS